MGRHRRNRRHLVNLIGPLYIHPLWAKWFHITDRRLKKGK